MYPESNTTSISVGRGTCREAFPYTERKEEPELAIHVKKKSVFYCLVPKIASTFTTGLLASMPICKNKQFCETKHPDKVFKTTHIANDVYSFMWVRDPYSRLFAAYENKIFFPNMNWYSLACKITFTIKNRNYDISELHDSLPAKEFDVGSASFGDPCSDEVKFYSEICPKGRESLAGNKRDMYSVRDMHNVTFAEFIRYIITRSSGNLDCINIHFRPIYKLCNPCELRFDFIGRFESFSDSIDHLCKKLDKIGIITGIDRSCNSSKLVRKIVPSPVRHAFIFLQSLNANNPKTVSNKQTSLTDLRREVFLKVWSSFQIRGFVSKSISMPFSYAELEEVTMESFTAAVNDAIESSTNKEVLKAQRRDAMLQAYSTVPMEDMYRLKEYVQKDCLLFDYDDEPEELFNRRNEENRVLDFDYFAGLLDKDVTN